jgi:pimeloyl-ACP methyl ester carboxylesterase
MFQRAVSILALLFCAACTPAVRFPIDTVHYDAAAAPGSRMLIVFLPGNGDPISVFQKKGLIADVRQHGLPADMIAVDAHLGYYLNGSIFSRLKEDVIDPARARGYDRVWLVGNSLGGYGSLSYAREHPEDVTGVVLLGPFLGRKETIDEIKRSGGVLQWQPSGIPEKSVKDWEDRLWLWIKANVRSGSLRAEVDSRERPAGYSPIIYIGYGRRDRLSEGQELFASLLPPDHVIAIDGGHDWPTWKKLWDLFLDRNIFEGTTGVEAAPAEVKP